MFSEESFVFSRNSLDSVLLFVGVVAIVLFVVIAIRLGQTIVVPVGVD